MNVASPIAAPSHLSAATLELELGGARDGRGDARAEGLEERGRVVVGLAERQRGAARFEDGELFRGW